MTKFKNNIFIERESFSERVVRLALLIPKGRVSTYGRIARAAQGGNVASRCITGILGAASRNGVKNIPFHRIVYTDGQIWLNNKFKKERLKKYKDEKIIIDNKGKIKDFNNKVFNFI